MTSSNKMKLNVPSFEQQLAGDINENVFKTANELTKRAYTVLASEKSTEGDKQRAQGIKDAVRIIAWSIHPDTDSVMARLFEKAEMEAEFRIFDESGMPGNITADPAKNPLLNISSGVQTS